MSTGRKHFDYLDLQRLNALGVQGTRGEAEIGEFDVTARVDEEVLLTESITYLMLGTLRATHLGFQVTMDISEPVEFIHCYKHLTCIEARVFLRQYPSAVQEGAEVASRDIFHGQIYMLIVLECVQQPH